MTAKAQTPFVRFVADLLCVQIVVYNKHSTSIELKLNLVLKSERRKRYRCRIAWIRCDGQTVVLYNKSTTNRTVETVHYSWIQLAAVWCRVVTEDASWSADDR